MMNVLLVISFVISLFLLFVAVFLLLSTNKRNIELKNLLEIQKGEFQLLINKSLQEHLFQFQNSISIQIGQTHQHNKFVFEELERNGTTLAENVTTQLKEIKVIVNEKLHETLENRLSHSFRNVSASLEKVQLGLGEMKTLANGVGDLKRVLSNSKSRGVLGEIQLANIIDQILTQDQFSINVATIPNSSNFVEFAVKFPGNIEKLPYIWLPIDAKFPMEVYETLLNAYEDNEKLLIEKEQRSLKAAIFKSASEISKKYVYPPYTTDFAVMFLPTESLYAEVLRIPGLIMEVHQKHKIMIVGPNNLAAFLSSLRQGFKSIAIEKRTAEVWKLLATVRTEFQKFGDILERTQKKILEANKIVELAGSKSRTISKKLEKIENHQFDGNRLLPEDNLKKY